MLGTAPTIALAKSKAHRPLMILIFASLGFSALVVLLFALAWQLQSSAPARSVSDDSITAEKLIYDYNVNAIFADRTYRDKIIVVRGSVGKITRGMGNNNVLGDSVDLRDADADSEWVVRCEFPKDQESRVASLRPGDSIKVQGTCQGTFFSSVELKNCVIESSD
jgi:hypothetical protein